MREIKFRAFYKPNKKMYQVGQVTLQKGTWNYEPENKNYIGVCVPYQPSFILMQYTGLHDKNGKEIYEGDIVKATFGLEEVVGYISFAQGCFLLVNSGVSDNQIFVFHNIEVIGNIYDNPELLEKGE